MSFFWAVLVCLRKYVRFSGRASRAEYWNFVLFAVVISVALNVVDRVLFGLHFRFGIDGVLIETNGPLSSLFGLAMLLPVLAAGWRRMHDTGRSGIYLLYPLIAVLGVSTFFGFLRGYGPLLTREPWEFLGGVGTIVALVALFVLTISPMVVVWWLTWPSDVGDNLYGPQPKMRAVP